MLSPCWPNEEQELLLKACLWNGEPALRAWEKWIKRADIDKPDHGSYRLLSLLYYNLKDEGIQHPIFEKLKGLYRKAWFRSQLLFHQGAFVLRVFREAGIPAVILKGAAASVMFYKEFGVRPMDDFDILVPRKYALRAADILARHGWKLKSSCSFKKLLATRHGEEFIKGTDSSIDLHWHVLEHRLSQKIDKDFWKAVVPVKVENVPALALSPEDQILHACVHGCRSQAIPPLRWLADSFTIIKKSNTLNWNRLKRLAQKEDVALPVRDTLFYLKETLNASVPDTALTAFSQLRISAKQRVLFESLQDSPRTVLEFFLWHWYRYSKKTSSHNLFVRALRFPFYLKKYWELNHMWQLPFQLLSKWNEKRKLARSQPRVQVNLNSSTVHKSF